MQEAKLRVIGKIGNTKQPIYNQTSIIIIPLNSDLSISFE